MLLALRLGSLLVPVNDRLVRDTIGVVKDLDDAGERLHDSSVRVTVQLNGVDEADFSLGALTERLDERRSGLGVSGSS